MIALLHGNHPRNFSYLIVVNNTFSNVDFRNKLFLQNIFSMQLIIIDQLINSSTTTLNIDIIYVSIFINSHRSADLVVDIDCEFREYTRSFHYRRLINYCLVVALKNDWREESRYSIRKLSRVRCLFSSSLVFVLCAVVNFFLQ